VQNLTINKADVTSLNGKADAADFQSLKGKVNADAVVLRTKADVADVRELKVLYNAAKPDVKKWTHQETVSYRDVFGHGKGTGTGTYFTENIICPQDRLVVEATMQCCLEWDERWIEHNPVNSSTRGQLKVKLVATDHATNTTATAEVDVWETTGFFHSRSITRSIRRPVSMILSHKVTPHSRINLALYVMCSGSERDIAYRGTIGNVTLKTHSHPEQDAVLP